MSTESSFARARRDAGKAFHSIWLRLTELFIGAGLSIWVLLWNPNFADRGNPMVLYRVLVPVGGILAGLLAFFLVTWYWAPYRQRNEARGLPIQNADVEDDPLIKRTVKDADTITIDGPDRQYSLAEIMVAMERHLVTGMGHFLFMAQPLNDKFGIEWSHQEAQEVLAQLRLLGVVDIERVDPSPGTRLSRTPMDMPYDRYTWNGVGIRVLSIMKRSRQ